MAEAGRQATRVALTTTAAAFTGFGIACLVRPDIVRHVGVKPASRTGTAEIRAMYGGMELGLGAFFTYALARPELHRAALLAQTFGLGGLALGRLLAVLHDRPGHMMKLLLAAEAGAALTGAIALARSSRPAR